MKNKVKHTAKVGLLIGLCQLVVSPSHGIEDPNAGSAFDTTGVQARVGKVTRIRVAAGETRFQIDSCPENPIAPGFFVVAFNNPDKLDITRLLIAAMTFKKEVKLYNATFGADIDYCPRTGMSAGNITVGTVRVQ